ncbi:hypothetical protein OEZ86_004412 [Tetradesmus obliquus]|nr:hypothetical protein OEZ86_004412 [Tetradesmus obliquus]
MVTAAANFMSTVAAGCTAVQALMGAAPLVALTEEPAARRRAALRRYTAQWSEAEQFSAGAVCQRLHIITRCISSPQKPVP